MDGLFRAPAARPHRGPLAPVPCQMRSTLFRAQAALPHRGAALWLAGHGNTLRCSGPQRPGPAPSRAAHRPPRSPDCGRHPVPGPQRLGPIAGGTRRAVGPVCGCCSGPQPPGPIAGPGGPPTPPRAVALFRASAARPHRGNPGTDQVWTVPPALFRALSGPAQIAGVSAGGTPRCTRRSVPGLSGPAPSRELLQLRLGGVQSVAVPGPAAWPHHCPSL